MSFWIYSLGGMYILIGVLGFLAWIFEGVKMSNEDHLVFLAGFFICYLNYQLNKSSNKKENSGGGK